MKKLLMPLVLVAALPGFARGLVDYVNPEMGYISHMLVPAFPTVQRPNAMLRFTPPAATATDDKVGPFYLQLLGHRGHSVFPMRVYSDKAENNAAHRSMTWDQQDSRPYRYSVYIDSEDITFQLAPGEKAALVRLGYERKDSPRGVYLGARDGEVALDGSNVSITENFSGMKLYLYGQFDAPLENVVKTGHGVAFELGGSKSHVNFRYAVSYVSPEQAKANLAAEISDWKFEKLAKAAETAWNDKLGKIYVEGDEENKRIFYTSLWRTYERMVNITEDGKYLGWDGKIHETGGVDRYVDDWTWDTYRAHHPLMCMLEPQAESAKLNSYLRMADETKEGWVPLFPQLTRDNHGMNGFHPAAIFLDAWRKGIPGVDWKAAFQKLAHTERTSSRLPWYRGPRFSLDEFYDAHGYFPALPPKADGSWADDPEWPQGHGTYERRQAVAVTLAYSFDAWCLAELAKEFGTKEDVEEFTRKSRFFENLWNPETKFFHPKDKDGKFIQPFDYRTAGGQGARDYYDENNAWTYIWDVPHDLPRLVQLLGGKAGMSAKLDEMFNTGYGMARWDFYKSLPDSTAMMGMFTMANEPSFHIPYLYNYAGEPWKTQKLIRKIIKCWFRNDLMGIPGDEDGGGMSAFVVYSMMGFYPVTPGTNSYAVGSPMFRRVEVDIGGGKKFTLEAPQTSEDRKYVQHMKIDGLECGAPVMPHSAIAEGRLVQIEMGDRPNRSFGRGAEEAQ